MAEKIKKIRNCWFCRICRATNDLGSERCWSCDAAREDVDSDLKRPSA